MNNLPRKIFNYKTAKEEFIKEIKQLKSIYFYCFVLNEPLNSFHL